MLSTRPSGYFSLIVAGTRELVIPSLPFIVAYTATEGRVEILAVLHAARRWPEGF